MQIFLLEDEIDQVNQPPSNRHFSPHPGDNVGQNQLPQQVVLVLLENYVGHEVNEIESDVVRVPDQVDDVVQKLGSHFVFAVAQ